MKNSLRNSEFALFEQTELVSRHRIFTSPLNETSKTKRLSGNGNCFSASVGQHASMSSIKPALVLAFLLFSAIFSDYTCSAPQVRILQSPLSSKIEQPTITAVFKDRNGFLWIGTQHGLYKYDGVRFSKFGSDLTGKKWIPASYIMRISEDSNGRIIVATFGGGLLGWSFYSESFQVIEKSESADLAFVTELVIAGSDVAWIGTKSGLYRHDLSETVSPTSRPVTPLDIGNSTEISAITSDFKGKIYIAFGSNIYVVSEKTDSWEEVKWRESADKTQERVTALALSSSGRIFIGTDRGLLVSQDLTDPIDRVENQLEENSPTSITALLFHNNLLWIGTKHGLSYSDEGLAFIETFSSQNSRLSNSEITTLFADGELIWVGTYHGLNTISFVPFETYNQENSGVYNDVLAFTEDQKNNLWIGTFNGLYLFDKKLRRHMHFRDLSDSDEIFDHRIMTMSSKGNELWLGFQNNGLQIVNTDTLAVRRPLIDNLDQLEVTKILHTRDDRTWIATFNQGAYMLENDRATSYLSSGALPESSITILFQPQHGGIIASSERKIYQYQEETDKFYALDFSFLQSKETPLILSISESGNGDIWIGTKDLGLFIWKKSDRVRGDFSLERSLSNANFSTSTVYAIRFDDNGDAWCSTQSGIVNLDRYGIFISRFSTSDGLQGSDFNFGASFKDSAGRMYFGGSNGYNRFLPEHVETDKSPPRLVLTRVSLSGLGSLDSFNTPALESIQLTHKDYFVQFDFSVLDFLDPDKNEYRYMLDGFDPDWIENGNRNSATYTSLPAGNYTLRIQGANSAGVWNREGLSIAVEVLPPPWKTWWAYCGYALLLLFFGWLGKRAYDSYVVEKRARVMALEMIASENRADDEMQEQLEIHDDLVRAVYRHSVSTLNLVSEVICIKGSWLSGEDAREVTDGNIKRVTALAQLEDCLYSQNEILLADMKKFTDIILSRLLEDSPVLEEMVTTINEVSSRPFPFELASPLAIAMYELLENALQHAFYGPEPHYVHVTLARLPSAQNGSDCRLTIEDNGAGIPANIDPLSAQTSGLAVVSSMVQRLSGQVSYTLTKGTLVTITFHCPDI